ncbi:MAG: acetyl-CoA carboxylase biotin carboxyl carrier protein subunit [Bacteroidota bacterium]|nr:acetyl-CoA carboxylase biotin carboxyl carrier protein subunit [Bacteroidota bacterium]
MSDEKNIQRLVIDDTPYETRFTRKFERRKSWQPPDPRQVLAFIPGSIVEIHVEAGQRVRWGDSLLILEAMKMKNDVTAAQDALVKAVHVKKGDKVMKNQLLIEFE